MCSQRSILLQFLIQICRVVPLQSDLEPCYQLSKRQRVAAQVGGSHNFSTYAGAALVQGQKLACTANLTCALREACGAPRHSLDMNATSFKCRVA